LSYICARSNKTISTGYIARYDKQSAQEYKDELDAAMKLAHYDENTVYLAHLKYYDLFNEGLTQKKLKVSMLDSVLIFYSETRETEVLKKLYFDGKDVSIDRFILDYQDEIIFISVKDEATNSFKESTKAIFRDKNIPIDEFKYRGSFACVLYKGNSIFYKIGNADSVSVSFTKDSIVGDLKFRKNVKLISKGFDAGDYSSISIDGTEHSSNMRGFNIVVTDTAFNVIKSVNFDTHKPFE
jgi:hypothetical protein